MKKTLCLLLAWTFVLSFAACGEKTAEGEGATTTTAAENQITTTATAVATTTTKATTTTTKPQKLNPKTNFKFGTYKATFFENNTQSYHEVTLCFYEEFNTVQIGRTNYYSIEQCKKKYEDWGATFDENDFMSEGEKTVGGVTYYDIGDWTNVPITYELTDTLVKTDTDEGYVGEFSLNPDGTLTLEKQDNTFGKKGTVYTFSGE